MKFSIFFVCDSSMVTPSKLHITENPIEESGYTTCNYKYSVFLHFFRFNIFFSFICRTQHFVLSFQQIYFSFVNISLYLIHCFCCRFFPRFSSLFLWLWLLHDVLLNYYLSFAVRLLEINVIYFVYLVFVCGCRIWCYSSL